MAPPETAGVALYGKLDDGAGRASPYIAVRPEAFQPPLETFFRRHMRFVY